MIRHLEVSSFKSLRKASLDFSNINIFIFLCFLLVVTVIAVIW